MQIQIQSVHFTAGEALQKMVNAKCLTLEKLNDHIIKCAVILSEEKNDRQERFKVEVKLSVPQNDFFAEGRATGFGKALDKVITALKKQLIKHKGKVKKEFTL